jgi:hypothetical protein
MPPCRRCARCRCHGGGDPDCPVTGECYSSRLHLRPRWPFPASRTPSAASRGQRSDGVNVRALSERSPWPRCAQVQM